MTAVLATAAATPADARVAVARLNAECQSATIRIDRCADRYIHVRTTEPKPRPTNHPIDPATPKSRKLSTIQNYLAEPEVPIAAGPAGGQGAAS